MKSETAMNNVLKLILVTSAAFFVDGVWSDEPIAKPSAKPDAREADAKPRQLLVGDTLGLWKEADYGGQGVVEMKKGVLSLGSGDPITAVRWAGKLGDGPKQFPKTNYRLAYEARRTLGRDFFGTVTFPVGEESCSLVVGGWGGGLTGLSSLNGDDAANNSTTGYTAFENDKWYRFAITVTPEKITATQDGEELFPAIQVDEQQIGIRIEMEPCRPLGIATFTSGGDVRNLTVTRLKKSTKP